MFVSVVLRLVPRALSDGRIVGEAELVRSGEKALVRSADELLAFLRGGRDRDREGGSSDGGD